MKLSIGQTKIRRYFAVFPITLGGEKRYWEWVNVEYESQDVACTGITWIATRFVPDKEMPLGIADLPHYPGG